MGCDCSPQGSGGGGGGGPAPNQLYGASQQVNRNLIETIYIHPIGSQISFTEDLMSISAGRAIHIKAVRVRLANTITNDAGTVKFGLLINESFDATTEITFNALDTEQAKEVTGLNIAVAKDVKIVWRQVSALTGTGVNGRFNMYEVEYSVD